MIEFQISTSQVIFICSLISALWGVYKIIKEVRKPSKDLQEEVNKHANLLDTDNTRLKEVENSNKMILQCLLVIINHDITGNGIDKLKSTRDKLQEYLIEK